MIRPAAGAGLTGLLCGGFSLGFLQRFLLQLLYGFRVTGYALAPFPFTLHVRKFKPESGTFPNFAVDAVIGMVESEDAFYNGKAQPAAFGGTDIIGAGLVISVPYMRQFFLRYARTVVGDFDSEFFAHTAYVYDYLLILAAVFDQHC